MNSNLWKFNSVSFIDYNQLCAVVNDLVGNLSKLKQLQERGHSPLILFRYETDRFQIASAPGTLDILEDIDPRFKIFNKEFRLAPIDPSVINTHRLLLGNELVCRDIIQKSVPA